MEETRQYVSQENNNSKNDGAMLPSIQLDKKQTIQFYLDSSHKLQIFCVEEGGKKLEVSDYNKFKHEFLIATLKREYEMLKETSASLFPEKKYYANFSEYFKETFHKFNESILKEVVVLIITNENMNFYSSIKDTQCVFAVKSELVKQSYFNALLNGGFCRQEHDFVLINHGFPIAVKTLVSNIDCEFPRRKKFKIISYDEETAQADDYFLNAKYSFFYSSNTASLRNNKFNRRYFNNEINEIRKIAVKKENFLKEVEKLFYSFLDLGNFFLVKILFLECGIKTIYDFDDNGKSFLHKTACAFSSKMGETDEPFLKYEYTIFYEKVITFFIQQGCSLKKPDKNGKSSLDYMKNVPEAIIDSLMEVERKQNGHESIWKKYSYSGVKF